MLLRTAAAVWGAELPRSNTGVSAPTGVSGPAVRSLRPKQDFLNRRDSTTARAVWGPESPRSRSGVSGHTGVSGLPDRSFRPAEKMSYAEAAAKSSPEFPLGPEFPVSLTGVSGLSGQKNG